MPDEPVQCPDCGCWTYNGPNHRCTVYDGPPCTICGEPTVFYTVGAPGIGSGYACRAGHQVHLTPHRLLTLAEVA